jgi:hypothetical protein
MKHCKKQVEDRYDGISVCVVCGAWHRFALGVWCKTPAPELMWVTRDRRKIRMADMDEGEPEHDVDLLRNEIRRIQQGSLCLRVEALEDEVRRRGLDKWDKFLGRTVEGLL